jgi:uncharacterized protein (DUF1330 family)
VSAYVVVEIEVTDPVGYEEYKKLAPPTIAQYGGKYLARGGTTETLEGDWSPKRLVILEFPTFDQAKKWHQSPEYADAKQLRLRTTKSKMVLLQGL